MTDRNSRTPVSVVTARPLTTPANIVLASAGLCAVVALVLARTSAALLLFGLLTDGLIALGWLAAATGCGLIVLRAARVRFESLALEIAGTAALGLGIQSILILLLGLAGLMNRPVAIALVGSGLILFFLRVPSLVSRPRDNSGSSLWNWFWLLAMPGLGIALACAFLPPGLLWGADEPNAYDVLEYHFQLPREWYELRRITPLKHNIFSYFPFNVEMHYLLAMHVRGGPWAGMYLAQLMHAGFIALSVVAVYGVLREMGARHAALGAVATAVTPWLILLAPIGFNEGGLLLFGALAIGLMMLALRSSQPMRLAALAGAMTGLACGTKLTAVPMVLLAVPVAALVVWRGRLARVHLIFIALGTLTVSPWLIRNFAWTGNPVFPELPGLFGRAHLSEAQLERWQRAHSPRDDQRSVPARVKEMSNQIVLDWRFGFALLPLALIAFALNEKDGDARYLLLILLILSLIWLFFTHLQGRFFVLAIPVAGMLIGLIAQRTSAWIVAVVIAVMAIGGTMTVWMRIPANSELLIGLPRLSLFSPLAETEPSPEEMVVLVGDARAFLYDNVPTQRLRYRTVFDVSASPGDTSVDAWLRDVSIEPGRTLLVIDAAELQRFARTYRHIPPPPPELVGRLEPVVVRR